MRYLILLALLLTATPAFAGPEFLACIGKACKAQFGAASTINGATVSDMNDGGSSAGSGFDSGTGTPSPSPLCSGTASVTVSCDGGTSGSFSQIVLYINGTSVQTLSCGAAVTHVNSVLSWPVNGRYTARLVGNKSGDATFSASNFSFPITQ